MTQRHRDHRDKGTARPTRDLEEINEITAQIIDVAVRIHTEWGPGLSEIAYEKKLAWDLRAQGRSVVRQRRVSFVEGRVSYREAFRPDLIVDGCVVVEIKARPWNSPLFTRQLLTYLKLLDLRVGLVLNFGMPRMKDGIKRVINGY